MHAIGADRRASLVIYYRPDTSGQQIEEFVEHKLENYPSKVHDGKDFPEFVVEYLALPPSEANGFHGSALTFRPDANPINVDSFISMVQSDPRVARIFRDTSPNAIHLQTAQQAAVPPTHKQR